jgi:Ca2+-binding RTX toxin-like protein
MFAGTRVTLEIFAPDLGNPITRPARRTIDDQQIEFDNAAFFDINGDRYSVVQGQFDILGSMLSYKLLQGGSFLNVDDATGFNGYALTYAALTGSGGKMAIRAADLLDAQSTLGVTQRSITFDRDTVFVNVDGLRFSRHDTALIQLGFRIDGTARADWLVGDDGRDRLAGFGGRDHLAGGAGRDALLGGAGADTLDGGTGRDTLTGGSGADHFVLRRGGQADVVRDFQNGTDRILVRSSADGFVDLGRRQAGDDVIITSDGASLRIEDTRLSDLTAQDFLF